ncbi:ABC transporter ATP-binding protein [Mesorhizobium sp. M00.F.Ca.ET.216.01.1.1]|nr:ABC transporter ATP-binding protein [Mesorhizobium sp. M00.F.Ca.ET.216.01.1.1]TIS58941.1 MAG: ATP-binding cassette domain-containing protein [Mesorhizobium sp.]TIS92282.1 MAG: ATP-binding cassette domain-containing protein [Mesorhizobium sp.]TJW18183.1 MAG: ATP-binding cassette domain-containing protein [Mesorhizobium sp.]TJW47277.1 MAG: ATP-binding cassette domain-containing protein [Mesorhizobium sp.]
MSLFARLQRLFRLAAAPAWAGPTVVGLGLAAAVLEGAGLFLFIPLLQSLGASPSQSGRWQPIFDRLLAPVPEHLVTAFLVGALCVSIVLKNAVLLVNTWVTRYVDGLVAHQLRSRVFDQTISSCIDYRVENKRSDIITTIANNTWKVSQGLALAYRLMVCACTFVVFVLLMLLISIRLTFFSMAFLFIGAMAIRLATRRADETGKAVVEENKQFGLRMWESINSLQLIRAFAQEDYERRRFLQVSDRVRQRLLRLDMLWATPGPVSEISITVLIGALVLIAESASIGIAALAAFLSLLYRLQGPTRELLQSKIALDGLAGAIDDVEDFLRRTETPFLSQGSLSAPALSTAVEFRNVCFRYAPDQPLALQDVSFSIPAGKTTAIVGESGAGKSTVMALLFRFLDPTSGEIVADGTPLAAFDLRSWRKRLSLMSQEVYLFNDTIAANIAYGDFDTSPDDLRQAAHIAKADDFIRSLPDGYETQIGDQGMRLSGGQRQRIALARTILRNPDILLLDEATNALDVETEQAFQLALEQYSHNRTVVVIAHRLSTVQAADQIIVMAKGRVIEVGSPEQLLKRPGQFSRLHEFQHGRAAIGAT